MHPIDITPSARITSFPAPPGGAAAIGAQEPLRATFGGPEFDPYAGPIDRLPAWLAGGIVVGLSGVFWIGILTIVGWLV